MFIYFTDTLFLEQCQSVCKKQAAGQDQSINIRQNLKKKQEACSEAPAAGTAACRLRCQLTTQHGSGASLLPTAAGQTPGLWLKP